MVHVPSSLQESFRFCENLAKSHYENFPIGWFIPKATRPYVFAIYAFARTADDFSDEESFKQERSSRLDEYEALLDQAIAGHPPADQPVFVAIAHTLEKTNIPPQLLKDLLTAFRLDITKKRYRSYEELKSYCVYSANPIGRIVLILFGYQDPELLKLSDRICTGIQLVNHWQDIGIDLMKDRIYLPEEDLERFGYRYEELRERQVNDAFRSLMRFEVARTRSLFFEGKPLLQELNRRLRCQVSLMWKGPMKILDRMEARGFDVFHSRPTLSKRDLLRLSLPILLGKKL